MSGSLKRLFSDARYDMDRAVWKGFESVVASAPCPKKKLKLSDDRGAAPAFVVVLLCAGGMLGTDSLEPLGGRLVLAVDLRKAYLDAFGRKNAVVWQRRRRQQILQALAAHDDRCEPFKLAASVQRGFYVPEMLYEGVDGVGTLLGAAKSATSDLNLLLGVVRRKYPESKVVLMASPPCRMFSNANQRSSPEDKDEFLSVTVRLLQRMRWSQHLGLCDAVLVECSAPGRHHSGVFVPGTACQRMVDALNCVGKPVYKADKINAADYGAYTNRSRLFIAPEIAHAMLPDRVGTKRDVKVDDTSPLPPKDHRGWGWPLGVGSSSHLRLRGGTWMPEEFSGAAPHEPGPTLTTHKVFLFPEGRSKVTLVPVKRRGVLMGLRADDIRLERLRSMSSKSRNTLTGITFCVQYYLATLAAVAGSLRGNGDQQVVSAQYWAYENARHATHPPSRRGRAARRYNLEAERMEGLLDPQTYAARYERLWGSKKKET